MAMSAMAGAGFAVIETEVALWRARNIPRLSSGARPRLQVQRVRRLLARRPDNRPCLAACLRLRRMSSVKIILDDVAECELDDLRFFDLSTKRGRAISPGRHFDCVSLDWRSPSVSPSSGEPEVESDCLMNDLGREPVSGIADFLRWLGYRAAGRVAPELDNDAFCRCSEARNGQQATLLNALHRRE
jgi:hypothetical protein